MDDSKLIQAESLSKRYGSVQALKNVSLSAGRGDVVGVLGPNGAGKSTTMRILTGIMPPSEGQVTVGGFDLFESPVHARRQIGYLPELPPVYRDQTVDEYLTYCGQLRGISAKALKESVKKSLTRCQLTQMRRRLIGNLSKGYQQRLGIAQAIIHEPDILVLDEPTVGLDPSQILEIRALIRELGENRVVILSTHILQEVEAVCNRVIMLNQGRVVFSGSMDSFTGADENSWRIHFNTPPSIEQFSAQIPDLEVTDENDTGTFVISNLKDPSKRASVLEKAVSAGWQPTGFEPVSKQLEQVFIDHTCKDKGVD